MKGLSADMVLMGGQLYSSRRRRCLKVMISMTLFSGMLLTLIAVLFFLSKHEPDPTPDKVGFLRIDPVLTQTRLV